MSQAESSTSSSDPEAARPDRCLALARRGLLGTVLAAGLGGCGFRPINGPPAVGETEIGPELAAVRIGRTYGRTGQLLHQALERRLASRDRTPAAARYELSLSLLPAYEAQGYRRDGAPSRFRMVMNAPWTLSTLTVPARQLASGTARAIDSYNATDNEYFAAIVSSETAERRLMEQLAETIVERLAIALRDIPPAEAPPRVSAGA